MIGRSFRLWHVSVLAVVGLLAGCRQDMHDQPRFKPLARNDFFADQRASRPLVEGTVARGQLNADTYLYTGKVGGNPGDGMPFPVTMDLLKRGQERYNIYCAPCHSRVGDGAGMIPSRGFSRRPPSYHIDRLRKVPDGYMYDVVTNGFGIMQGYSAQVPVNDRWAIVAYIRALQLSQNATTKEVPAGQRIPSTPPNFTGNAPSGATALHPSMPSESHEAGKVGGENHE